MAQVKPEFEALEEFEEIAKKCVDKFEHLYGIDVTKIRAVAITNKDRNEKSEDPFTVTPVKFPVRFDSKYAYYITFYSREWEQMSTEHKHLAVYKALKMVPTSEEDEGKLNQPDLTDFEDLVNKFGTHYFKADRLPDILSTDFKM